VQALYTTIKNAYILLAQWFRILWAHCQRPIIALGTGGYQAGAIAPEARLSAKIIHSDGQETDQGILSTKMVTLGFVQFIVAQLQSSSGEIDGFYWHAMGTNAISESAVNTGLGAPVEARVPGNKTEGSAANIYQTVATITATSPRSITEHGVFNGLTGGILMDRSVFGAINLDTSDAIQFTYELTVPAGN